MGYFRQCGSRIIISITCAILAVFLTYMDCMPVCAAEIGTIVEQWEHVYEKSDTGANIVANVILGYNFPILAEETDEGGNVWYLIETDMGVQGYIPAQSVIKVAADSQNENTHERGAQVQNPEPEEENENENNLPDSVEKQLLTMEVVNIRENPSTDEEILGKIPRGTTLDYIDTITNTIGEVWYEVSYEDVYGFIKQSTVKEIEVPVQGTVGTQMYAAGMTTENIDIERLIEIARLYQDENPVGESVAEADTLEKTQTQEQIIYDGITIDENAGGKKKMLSVLQPDMVIILSLAGILLCAVIISQTFRRMMKLYR